MFSETLVWNGIIVSLINSFVVVFLFFLEINIDDILVSFPGIYFGFNAIKQALDILLNGYRGTRENVVLLGKKNYTMSWNYPNLATSNDISSKVKFILKILINIFEMLLSHFIF